MLTKHSITTKQKEALYDITAIIKECITKSQVKNSICVVYSPHTTSAITINENADHDVQTDFIKGLAEALPDRQYFRHMEGNSDAHIKSSCIGASETILIEEGKPLLGTWQGIYFCEFDGPRQRSFYVKIL